MKLQIIRGALLALLSSLVSVVHAAAQPNIVIIMSDDSGYTDLGCYGGEIDTPNIDRLAAQGMRLSSFYTNGRCSPTRASLLSGMDCARVGFGGGSLGDWSRQINSPAHRGRLPYEIPLLPELLKEAGYHTMMAGKWHLGGSVMKGSKGMQAQWKKYHAGWELTDAELESDFLALPSQRGFDEFFGMFGAQGNFFVTPADGHEYMEGNKPAKLTIDKIYSMHCYSKKNSGNAYSRNHGKTSKAFYDTDGVTDRAIEMIEGASGEGKPPFLMYLAYRAPHLPLQAPEELVQKYLPRYQDLANVESDRVAGLTTEKLYPNAAKSRTKWVPPGKADDFRRQLAIHAAMMDKVDENVGRVLRTLEETGELENSLILYFSDNGCASHIEGFMNTPYFGSKALVWEGGTKTHFIAVWPEHIKPGSISHDQAWVGDLLPTFLEIAGVSYPNTFRETPTPPLAGRSILPTLTGAKVPPHETLFFNDKGQQSVIHKGRWKLLIEPGWYLQTRDEPGIAYELYDLQSDPAETNNLANTKPEMVQMLSRLCEIWKTESGIVDYAEIIKILPNDPF